MPQITNSQLLDCLHKLEDRVKRLEEQSDENGARHNRLETKIEAVSAKISSFEQNMVFWQRVGSFISPIIAGIIIVVIQHIFFH